jgi:hypothetical protein
MSDLDLGKIKDTSRSLFKDNAPDPGKVGHFLTECWVESVIKELNRLRYTNIEIIRDHSYMIKEK